MPISLSLQEKLRKPLMVFSNVLHRSNLYQFYIKLTNPLNRFTFYTSPYFKSLEVDCFIDVGANSGEFIHLILNSHKQLPVYAFEPINDEYQKLFKSFSRYPNIYLFNLALGAENKSSTINISNFSPSSSILDSDPKLLKKQKIEIQKLDTFIETFRNYSAIFCKIDVEGYELEVLKGAINTLQYIRYIYIEARTTNYVGCNFQDIYTLFQNHGWYYLGNYDTALKKSGEISHFDALFINKKYK